MIKKYFSETWNGLGGVLIFFRPSLGGMMIRNFFRETNFFEGLNTPKRTPKTPKNYKKTPKDSFLKSRWQAAVLLLSPVEDHMANFPSIHVVG